MKMSNQKSLTMFLYILSVCFLLILLCCTHKNANIVTTNELVSTTVQTSPVIKKDTTVYFQDFDRASIVKKLQEKQKENQPLVVHTFVPLCDNTYQGIVPVNAKLGDGQNLQTNLYWGAAYGIKSFFKTQKNWELVSSKLAISEDVLERVVFKHKTLQPTVYLVADAYAGDKMKTCLSDYFQALAGKHQQTITITPTESINIYGKADLLAFNGHNGLMDVTTAYPKNQDGVKKDAVIMSCASFTYFEKYLQAGKGYPLLTTTNLLAPEAYVLAAIIESWAKQQSPADIRLAAAKAYNQYQKCGLNGAKRLFKTGW